MDFVSMLMEMQGGDVATQINVKMHELVAAVTGTGRKGELNIKIKFEPSKRAMGGGVLMISNTAEVTIKKPEPGLGMSLFFVDDDGNLRRDDPRNDIQGGLFETEKKEYKNAE